MREPKLALSLAERVAIVPDSELTSARSKLAFDTDWTSWRDLRSRVTPLVWSFAERPRSASPS